MNIKEALKIIKIEDEKSEKYTEALLFLNLILVQIEEKEQFLNDTQFKFGDDYDLKNTDEWMDLKNKRQEAREFVRANEIN